VRWRISRHALVRLVQRSQAHDAIKVPFPSGIAVVEKSTDSEFPIIHGAAPQERA
jgi:hypothetical protein